LVYEAIKAGVRHIDCACDYGNEESVGTGINRALSEGLLVLSKMLNIALHFFIDTIFALSSTILQYYQCILTH
jgi:diketogulonate reductase-like aldo/keto reductase